VLSEVWSGVCFLAWAEWAECAERVERLECAALGGRSLLSVWIVLYERAE
jgi:hypothetical protein